MLAFVVAAWAVAASDLEAEIERLRQRTAELEPRVQILQSSYLKDDAFDHDASVRQRVAQGETLFLLGDHARASVILFDVVSDLANTGHADYDLALYYLAESSYHSRNILGARHHFRELISRRNDTHLFDAFERLLQIADTLQDYAGVEEKVSELRAWGNGKLRPDVAYLYGKNLSRRGKSDAASAELSAVPEDHKYFHRARYVLGAEHVKQERWDEALACFDQIVKAEHPLGLGAKEADERTMREVAELAKARVWAERGDVERAMESYATISKESPYLDEALYEIAWMHVQGQKFRNALQAIDILLLNRGVTQDGRVYAPQAQLLKGNILLRLGRVSDAIDAFNRVNEVYEPVYRTLTDTLAKQKDPERYFSEVIAKNHGTYNAAAFLPPMATSWVSDERDVGRAVGVANDLLSGKQDVAEGKLIGQRVLSALAAKAPVEIFPLVKDGDKHASDLDRDLRAALEILLDLTKRALANGLDGATSEALARTTQARLKAQAALLEAQARRQNLSKEETHRRAAAAVLEHEVRRLRTEVTGARARLVAVQTFLDNPANRMSADAAQRLREQWSNEARVAQELERALGELELELQRARAQLAEGRVDVRGPHAAYDKALGDELGLLLQKSAQAGMVAAPIQAALAALRDRLGAIDAGLHDFRRRLDPMVEKRALEIAASAERELRQLELYEAELQRVEADSRSLIGGIAHRSFEDVTRKFYDVVLRADVGLIDVVWKEKEERTQTINGLVKEQKDAIRALDRDFDELRQR